MSKQPGIDNIEERTKIRRLVQNSKSIKAQNLVFHSATKQNKLNFVRLLVKNGVNLNTKDKQGKTALMWAAQLGFEESVKYLLDSGADPNISDHSGMTALHEAAFHGHFGALKLLIKFKADIEAVTKGGQTPLHFASNGHSEITRYLINKGADLTARDINGNTPFNWAISSGNIGIIDLFLDKNNDLVNGTEMPAIFSATIVGDTKVAGHLIERGANYGCVSGDDDSTVLHAAAIVDKINMIQFFIDQGMEVDIRDGDGWTPLHVAASRGFFNLTVFLVSSGADINAKTNKGSVPLKLAVLNERQNIIEFLIKNNADINATDDNGNTILNVAAKNTNLKMTLFLAGHGATLCPQSRNVLNPRHSIATIIDDIMRKESRNLESVLRDINTNYGIICGRTESIANLSIFQNP